MKEARMILQSGLHISFIFLFPTVKSALLLLFYRNGIGLARTFGALASLLVRADVLRAS